MKKLLFQKVFERAKAQSGKETKHGLSNYLSNLITDDLNFSVNPLTFVRYYEKYVEANTDVTFNPSSDLLDIISKYLECKSFEDFVFKNKISQNEENVDGKETHDPVQSKDFKWLKILISVSVSLGCLIVLFVYLNKSRFMIWEEDHYVEVPFETSKYNIGQLKRYKKERILNFKRIVPGCDSTVFFKKDKTVNLWYGKNANGKIEFFTDFGLHPETGKTLKAITTYIIDKYICIEE